MQKSNYSMGCFTWFHESSHLLSCSNFFRSTTFNQNMLFVCFVRLFWKTTPFSQNNQTGPESDKAQGPHSATHGYGRRFPVSPATGGSKGSCQRRYHGVSNVSGCWVHFGVVGNLKSSFFYFLIQCSFGKIYQTSLLKNMYLDDAPFGKVNRLKLREHMFGVHFQVSCGCSFNPKPWECLLYLWKCNQKHFRYSMYIKEATQVISEVVTEENHVIALESNTEPWPLDA